MYALPESATTTSGIVVSMDLVMPPARVRLSMISRATPSGSMMMVLITASAAWGLRAAYLYILDTEFSRLYLELHPADVIGGNSNRFR